MNQGEPAEHGEIFADAQGNVGKRLGRTIAGKPRRGLGCMSDETGAACEKRHDHRRCWAWISQHLNREQRAADWAYYRMDGVPDGINPRDFVCEKFEQIENTGDADNPRIAENFERLLLRREIDPVKMNGQPGDENCEIKIDPGKRSETERNAEQT